MHGNGRWQVSRAAFYGAVWLLPEGKPRAGEGVALIPAVAAPERSAGAPVSPLLTNGRPGHKWSWFVSRVDYYRRCLETRPAAAL